MLINQVGWRSTYLILAVVAAVLVLPWTLFVFKYKPEDKGLKPYGFEEKKNAEGVAVSAYPGVPARKALITVAFWALFLYGGVEALMSGYNTHLPGFSVSIGLGDMFGSQMLSLSMIGYVFATVIMGWLTDKIGVIIPSFITLLITALSLLGFAVLRDQMCVFLRYQFGHHHDQHGDARVGDIRKARLREDTFVHTHVGLHSGFRKQCHRVRVRRDGALRHLVLRGCRDHRDLCGASAHRRIAKEKDSTDAVDND